MMSILGPLTARRTSAVTVALGTVGVPTLGAPSPPTRRTWSKVTVLASPASRSMRMTSPLVTLYCLPLSAMIAYMVQAPIHKRRAIFDRLDGLSSDADRIVL